MQTLDPLQRTDRPKSRNVLHNWPGLPKSLKDRTQKPGTHRPKEQYTCGPGPAKVQDIVGVSGGNGGPSPSTKKRMVGLSSLASRESAKIHKRYVREEWRRRGRGEKGGGREEERKWEMRK